MLITFKSKAAADIVMYEEHAKRLLDVLGKDVKQGIITAAETDDAITRLEAEIAAERARREAAKQEAAKNDEDEEEDQQKPAEEPIALGTRAYPLLEMLRAASKSKHDVVWGV